MQALASRVHHLQSCCNCQLVAAGCRLICAPPTVSRRAPGFRARSMCSSWLSASGCTRSVLLIKITSANSTCGVASRAQGPGFAPPRESACARLETSGSPVTSPGNSQQKERFQGSGYADARFCFVHQDNVATLDVRQIASLIIYTLASQLCRRRTTGRSQSATVKWLTTYMHHDKNTNNAMQNEGQ